MIIIIIIMAMCDTKVALYDYFHSCFNLEYFREILRKSRKWLTLKRMEMVIECGTFVVWEH